MLSPMLRAHNRWAELFGAESYLMPDTRLGSASWWVPMTIVHGRGDSVVKMEYSREFIDAVREKFGDVRVELVTPEGEHGFDESVMEGDEGAGWLGDMLRGVERDWLE